MGEAKQMKVLDADIRSLVEPARVHRRVYIDEDLFQREMERLWKRAWVFVGHESQVQEPGGFLTTTLGIDPVVMVKDKRGEIHVLYNRCGHKGAKVTNKPCGKTPMFRCPYHGWSFNLDGSLNTTPHKVGYADTGFDKTDPEYHMRKVARVGNYRGFVFASQVDEGPDLETFLGDTKATIDNVLDRAPEGRVEIVGDSLRYMHDCNWKMFIENLNDGVHPMVAHASVGDACRRLISQLPEGAPLPTEAEIVFPFGSSYEFFDKMGVSVMPYGHSYMGGQSSIHQDYSDVPGYWDSMVARHGEEGARRVLAQNRHNTTIYPSFTIKDAIQAIRVARPVAVDKTLIETWHFRLIGAPEEMLHRTITYSRLINSPASMVGPDDWNCYARIQEALHSSGNEWVDLHRYLNREEMHEGNITRAPGTSDLSVRNQYQAWLDYMA